jgi:murein DD-endopeptidase MepM/ murein hydrolase activator NlpD
MILTISVLTAALAMQGRDRGDDSPAEDSSPITLPSDDKENEKKDPPSPENNKGEAEDTEDPDGTGGDKETVAPPEPEWVLPTNGHIFKGHSTEELVYSLTLGDYRTHTGVDVHADVGSEVKACLDGRIANVYYDPLMGHCVSIDHGNGVISVYKNLASELPAGISASASVKSGDVIGSVGESAVIEFSDEGHLHLEIYVNGKPCDPLSYLDFPSTPPEIEEE